MLDPFAPSTIGTAAARLNLFKSDATGQIGWGQINFLVTGTVVPPGNLWYVFGADFGAVLTAAISGVSRTLSNDNEYVLFVNDAGGQKCTGGLFNNLNFPVGPYLPGVACAYLSLYSATAGRSGRGIFRCAILDSTMISGDYVSSAFVAAATILGNWFLAPFTLHGLTFTPCLWSRTLNTFEPIVRFTIGNRISKLQKRRGWRQKINTQLPVVINWP